MSARSVAVRQRIEYRVARAFSALPPRLQVRLSGGKPVVVDGQTLEPDLQLALALIERQGLPPMETLTPEQARRVTLSQSRGSQGPPVPVGAVEDLQVDGATGPLPARHYAPAGFDGREPAALLVFFHGGGFVVGGPRQPRPALPAAVQARRRPRAERRVPQGARVPAARRLRRRRGRVRVGRGARARARRRPRAHRRRRRQRRRDDVGGGRGAGRARRRPRARLPAAALPGRRPRAGPATALARAVRRRLLPHRRADRLVRGPLHRHRATTGSRCSTRTSAGRAPSTSSAPGSTRCATRARPTARPCARRATRSRCGASRARSTASSTSRA